MAVAPDSVTGADARAIDAAQDQTDDASALDDAGKEKAKAESAKDDRNANATTLDEVRVTGIRYSVAKSLELKRESTSIVEVISAEDIGKLPDTKIGIASCRERVCKYV